MSLKEKIIEVYKEDRKSFYNHWIPAGISTLADAVTASCIESSGGNPAVNSSLTTFVGAASYWALFIGLTARTERAEMKDNSGKYDIKKTSSRAAQYLSFIGIGGVLYSSIRGTVQYQIQKRTALDAGLASLITDGICTTVYSVAVPPMRYMLKTIDKIFENDKNDHRNTI